MVPPESAAVRAGVRLLRSFHVDGVHLQIPGPRRRDRIRAVDGVFAHGLRDRRGTRQGRSGRPRAVCRGSRGQRGRQDHLRVQRADRQRKTAKADRLKALLARAGAYDRKDMIDGAIADYSTALMLDATLADTLNARGELWRRKGDRPRALADFGAALKLNPDHPAAKGNHRSLALELERVGALMAVDGKPSFNCASAKRTVEKAICANPELA